MKLVSTSNKNIRTSNPPRNTIPERRTAPERRAAPPQSYSTPPERHPAPPQGYNTQPEMRPAPPQGQNALPDRRPAPPQNTRVSRSPVPPGVNGVKRVPAKPIKKASPVKAILITLLIIIVIAASAFVALGFYVDSLDTVFPNVWAEGFNVSGLTLQETVEFLISEGYENNAEGISATVIFPDATSFTVTGDEVGLSFNAMEAAVAAFAFGRDDTFFRNEIQYIRSLFERTDLYDLSNPVYDDSIIHVLAAEYTENFNDTVFSGTLNRNDEYITIVRGTGIHPALVDNVSDLALNALRQAISAHDNIIVRYSPEGNADDSVEAQIHELQLLFSRIHEEPVSARWDVETLSATYSSNGRTFDLDQAVSDLRSSQSGQRIIIEIETLEPDYTQEFFESMLFAHTLASSTTRESTGVVNRLGNIQLAAEFINGKVINPGEIFSFNDTVGRRTSEKGFRPANTIRNGIFELGIGGGICQVSSTLHDAVLHTSLEVVERSPHGLRIAYMPVGEEGTVILSEALASSLTAAERTETLNMVGGRRFANDAMVNWGTNDYKFKNNSDFPIKLVLTMGGRGGRDLTVEIRGTRLDEDLNEDKSFFKVETVILSRFNSAPTRQPADWLPEGVEEIHPGARGQFGFRVQTFKLHFTEGGELISRTSITTRNYQAQSQITLVGTGPPVETTPPGDTTPPEDPPGGDDGGNTGGDG